MASVDKLQQQVDAIADRLERAQLAEYVQLLNAPRRLIFINLISGIARGVGIAIGFTIFSATIVFVLRQLGALDLPIIGQYIAELVESVQWHLGNRGGFY